ncbi:acyl carrier protein [Saccharothrix syringae]|uniref:Acyl carrier protein n=1 Tax=Saccharothrix syringae TaxID=103733 RepID=A0A5Q0GWH0_SACSY|nr:acyl carrier protein [Saccharothrix syringae]QFZ18407.1 acyl carrier protein [Saccharothrix syringae]
MTTAVPTHAEALAVVRGELARQLAVDVELIPPTARVYELPEVDSMKLMAALVAIEQRYGVTVEQSAEVVHLTIDELTAILVTTIEGQRA